MNCVVCSKSTKNTTKCTKCKNPFCTTCLKHRTKGRCPNCPRPQSAGGGGSVDFASNDFDAPGLFGASDGYSYFIFQESVPYRIIGKNEGFTGFSPKAKRIMGSIQQNYNPDDQGEDDLDEDYATVLKEYRCHGQTATTGHCTTCGLEVWEPSWDGTNAFDEPTPSTPERDPATLVQCGVGDRVMATWKSTTGTSYAAEVMSENADGTLALHYDDGSKDAEVPRSYIQSILTTVAEAAAAAEAARVDCGVGDAVKATWKSENGTQYGARVVALNDDGTVHLHYDDGSKDAAVPSTYIKTLVSTAADAAAALEAARVVCAVGDAVKATWKSEGGTEYAAKVVALNDDGTLHLHYDDGSKDAAVPSTYIKSKI